MQNKILNNNFFNLEDIYFKELLEGKSPWQSIEQLSDFIQSEFRNKKITPNYKNRNDVFIGEGTFIHPSVEIKGPAIIGSNCHLEHASFLREGCIIGDGVHVGHAVEVKHSIILNKSVMAHLNYIGDSIIGNNINISGGTILANFRLNKKNISINLDSEKIDTGLQKFGSVIGDNSVVGVNSVLNPGTILGKKTIVYPLKSVSGFHTDGETIK